MIFSLERQRNVCLPLARHVAPDPTWTSSLRTSVRCQVRSKAALQRTDCCDSPSFQAYCQELTTSHQDRRSDSWLSSFRAPALCCAVLPGLSTKAADHAVPCCTVLYASCTVPSQMHSCRAVPLCSVPFVGAEPCRTVPRRFALCFINAVHCKALALLSYCPRLRGPSPEDVNPLL